MAVAFAAHRRLNARFNQSFRVSNADVLRPAVAAAYQASIAFMLAGVQGSLQRIEHEFSAASNYPLASRRCAWETHR